MNKQTYLAKLAQLLRLGHETVFRCQRETAAIGYRQQVFELDDSHSLSYLHARKYKKNRYFAIIIRPSV